MTRHHPPSHRLLPIPSLSHRLLHIASLYYTDCSPCLLSHTDRSHGCHVYHTLLWWPNLLQTALMALSLKDCSDGPPFLTNCSHLSQNTPLVPHFSHIHCSNGPPIYHRLLLWFLYCVQTAPIVSHLFTQNASHEPSVTQAAAPCSSHRLLPQATDWLQQPHAIQWYLK